MNSFHKINLLFNCSSVSSLLFFAHLAKRVMAQTESFPLLMSFIMNKHHELVNTNFQCVTFHGNIHI